MEGVFRAQAHDLPAIKLLIAHNTVGGHLLPRYHAELLKAVRLGRLFIARDSSGEIVATLLLAVYNSRLAEGLAFAFKDQRSARIYGHKLIEWCRCELTRLGVQKFMVVTGDVTITKRSGFHLATQSERVAVFRSPVRMPSGEVAPATLDDVPGIYRLIKKLSGQGKLLYRSEYEITLCLDQFLVIRRSGRVIACVALEKYSRELAEVRSLAVAEEYQGNGLGADLVNACLSRAYRFRVREVMAVTGETKFFGKLGFITATSSQKYAMFMEF